MIKNILSKNLFRGNLFSFKSFSRKIYNNKSKANENFSYKIEDFNPRVSKYSLDQIEKHTPAPGVKVPQYLERDDVNAKIKQSLSNESTLGEKDNPNINKRPSIYLRKLKPGKKMTLPRKTFQKKMTKEESIENRKQLLIEEDVKNKSRLKLMSKEERKLLENNETALMRHEDNYEAIVKQKYRDELKKMKMMRREEKTKMFNTENLIDFQQEERLSKRMARLGVTSRRQADKLIRKGMVKIDGVTVKENVPVNDQTNIQVYSTNGYKTPIPESTRVWLFYKPTGFVCNTNDEKGRISIYSFLETKKFPYKHFMIAGKLDINSEGLVVLTNNGDLALALENDQTIEREYKVRVFGRMFTEEKINRIRRGIKINMKTIKLWAELIHKQNSNTWVHIKAYNNSIVDIRNVFRKLSLRVNRIIRTNYGPFSLGVLKNPGDVTETYIPRAVNNIMYHRLKEKTQSMVRKLDDTKLEHVKQSLLLEQRMNKKMHLEEKVQVDGKVQAKVQGNKKLKKIESRF